MVQFEPGICAWEESTTHYEHMVTLEAPVCFHKSKLSSPVYLTGCVTIQDVLAAIHCPILCMEPNRIKLGTQSLYLSYSLPLLHKLKASDKQCVPMVHAILCLHCSQTSVQLSRMKNNWQDDPVSVGLFINKGQPQNNKNITTWRRRMVDENPSSRYEGLLITVHDIKISRNYRS